MKVLRKSALRLLFFFIISSFVGSYTTSAQCAMCKGTVVSNQKEETGKALKKAKGLNAGILYLMVLPYIIGSVIAYMWYQNSKKEKAEKAKIEAALDKAFGNQSNV